MTRDEVFDEIYASLQVKLNNATLNPYGATMTNTIPNILPDSDFPLIVLSQLDYSLNRETLDKEKRKYSFSIECNVFSVNEGSVYARTIANQISNLTELHIDGYGLRLDMSDVVPNLQENVYRVLQRFSGVVDADSKIIYRE
jgi:hypothetical protein